MKKIHSADNDSGSSEAEPGITSLFPQLPIVLKVVTIVTILEFMIMWLLMLPVLRDINQYFIPVIDASLLAIFSSPIIYLWIVKPFVVALEARDQQLQLERLNKSYFESIGAIEHLTAGLVHEIGNPVAVIDGIVSEAEQYQQELPSELKRHIDIIKEQNNKLLLINNDLVNLAAPTSKEYQLLDFNEMVDQITGLLSYDERWYGVDIQFQRGSGLPAFFGCSGQLKLLINNFLNNSLEAMNKMPQQIQIITDLAADEIVLVIKDNGVGMNTETLKRAFNAFFSTKDPLNHSGMGLYSCLSILDNHQGRIHICSEPGLGTEVRVYFSTVRQNNKEGWQGTVSHPVIN